jgi:hypothetical protein
MLKRSTTHNPSIHSPACKTLLTTSNTIDTSALPRFNTKVQIRDEPTCAITTYRTCMHWPPATNSTLLPIATHTTKQLSETRPRDQNKKDMHACKNELPLFIPPASAQQVGRLARHSMACAHAMRAVTGIQCKIALTGMASVAQHRNQCMLKQPDASHMLSTQLSWCHH